MLTARCLLAGCLHFFLLALLGGKGCIVGVLFLPSHRVTVSSLYLVLSLSLSLKICQKYHTKILPKYEICMGAVSPGPSSLEKFPHPPALTL